MIRSLFFFYNRSLFFELFAKSTRSSGVIEFTLLEIIICHIVFIDPVTLIFLFIAEMNGELIPFFVGNNRFSILFVFI